MEAYYRAETRRLADESQLREDALRQEMDFHCREDREEREQMGRDARERRPDNRRNWRTTNNEGSYSKAHNRLHWMKIKKK